MKKEGNFGKNTGCNHVCIARAITLSSWSNYTQKGWLRIFDGHFNLLCSVHPQKKHYCWPISNKSPLSSTQNPQMTIEKREEDNTHKESLTNLITPWRQVCRKLWKSERGRGQLIKSDNLQYNTLVHWVAGTNDSLTKRLMILV